jgi:RNA polymerase sigma-70 factor (ECF subfamily)
MTKMKSGLYIDVDLLWSSMKTIARSEYSIGNKVAGSRVCSVDVRSENAVRFDNLMLPHLDAAYNLARWLVRRDADACDVVQDAYLRAWRFFDSFKHGDSSRARAWLLTIVRNVALTHIRRDRVRELHEADFDETTHVIDSSDDIDAASIREADEATLRAALEQLPPIMREAIVLREIEGLSYKEISDVVGVPIGTVMSRISRARQQLMHIVSASSHVTSATGGGV